MKNKWVNYWIDAGMGLSAAACFITGIIKWPGLITALGLKYSSLPMEGISALHDGSGIAIGLLAEAHVAMHAKWLMEMTKKALTTRGGTKDE